MKVLLIDPWGVRNTAEYLSGLIEGLADRTQLTVVTNYYSPCSSDKAVIKKMFFKLSENMQINRNNLLRKILHGFSYIRTYIRIIKLAKLEKFDVIHVNWLRLYKADAIFLKLLRRYCTRIVYTAHNPIPHVRGEKKIKELGKIYATVDRIIVHGAALKEELISLFPLSDKKIFIQRHGYTPRVVTGCTTDVLPEPLKEKIAEYEKVFLMCGEIYPNKGTDRMLKLWLDHFLESDALLIIAGRQSVNYPEFTQLEQHAEAAKNTEIIHQYVIQEQMDALFQSSDVILIPYIHASMSGTVFTAANFSKPVLCTKTGALPEYLEPGSDSILCENSEQGLLTAMDRALCMDTAELTLMGEKLHNNISSKCNWREIGKHIIDDIYS